MTQMQVHVGIVKALAKVFGSSNLLFQRHTVSCYCYLELVSFLRGWWSEGSLKPMAITDCSDGRTLLLKSPASKKIGEEAKAGRIWGEVTLMKHEEERDSPSPDVVLWRTLHLVSEAMLRPLGAEVLQQLLPLTKLVSDRYKYTK